MMKLSYLILVISVVGDFSKTIANPWCSITDKYLAKMRPPMRRRARTAEGAPRPRRCWAFGRWTQQRLPDLL
ncbi:hypothetical protein TNCV_4038401 [Trichonephila clavipes]|nr:hypothetical protein TNCV_4038401 [Trichonephila clavipes]